MLQKNAFVGVQTAFLRGKGVPFRLAERSMMFLTPQTHQAQVAAHGQQPAHRRAGGTVLPCAVPHLHIHVLCEILCIMRIFEVGKCKAVHRRPRAPVQLCQGFVLSAGNVDQHLLQLVPILCRSIFGCHQQAEH